jgi:2-octaprenyl-6-methoxyphenol hydroxylase
MPENGNAEAHGTNLVTSSSEAPAERLTTEILVVGAGLAGLAAAIGFAEAGFETILCGAPEAAGAGRTVALLDGSMRFLERLGLRPEIERRGAPLRALRLVDATGSLWRAPTVEFQASEIGLDAFGWNIENVELLGALAARADRQRRLFQIAGRVARHQWRSECGQVQCADGRIVEARLVVAADGRDSPARLAADVPTSSQSLPQTALTAILRHRRPHRDFSTEFHTREGPLTLVPLPPVGDDARSSLVWVMSSSQAVRRNALSDVELASEIEAEAQSIFGSMSLLGARGVFPLMRRKAWRLTAPRLALIGDAAHVLPPIGAQGLNLGLGDAAALIDAAAAATRRGEDVGGSGVLTRYESARRSDILLRTIAVNGLNGSLLARFGPLDFGRAGALAALSAIGPLRRMTMRAGLQAGLARRA